MLSCVSRGVQERRDTEGGRRLLILGCYILLCIFFFASVAHSVNSGYIGISTGTVSKWCSQNMKSFNHFEAMHPHPALVTTFHGPSSWNTMP